VRGDRQALCFADIFYRLESDNGDYMDSRTSSPTSLERAYLDRDKVNREMRRRQERLREQQRLMVRRFVDDHQGRM